MKIERLFIPLFLLISFCVSAERSYTEEEKVAFLKIWNTGISIALIGVDENLSDEVNEILAHQTPDRIGDNAYIYLMGLAKGSKTPYNTGLNVYQNMLEYKNSEHLGDEPEPRPEELQIPDIDLVCGGDYALCYELLASEEPPEHSNPKDNARRKGSN